MFQSKQTRFGLFAGCSGHLHLRGDSGNTLVETAFSIAILLTLLVGIMECGLLVYSYHFISNAAREGARYAIVRGTTWSQPPWNASGTCASYTDAGCIASSQNIQDYVASLAFPGIDSSNIQVTPTWYSLPGGTANVAYNAAGDYVQVKVQYTFPLSIPFVPKKSITMSSTSEMVITQ
jgi:Flp pilus assembly protein TadG